MWSLSSILCNEATWDLGFAFYLIILTVQWTQNLLSWLQTVNTLHTYPVWITFLVFCRVRIWNKAPMTDFCKTPNQASLSLQQSAKQNQASKPLDFTSSLSSLTAPFFQQTSESSATPPLIFVPLDHKHSFLPFLICGLSDLDHVWLIFHKT